MSSKALPMLFLAFGLTACVLPPPTPEEIANADYGKPIAQEEAQELAMAALRPILLDSGSVGASTGYSLGRRLYLVGWGKVKKGRRTPQLTPTPRG